MTWASEVAARNPILWYKLDETSGTSFVNSGSLGATYNGTGHGGLTLNQPSLAAGLPGGCVAFNGSTGYISVPAGALAGLSAITVLAWIKTSSTTANLEILSADTSSQRVFQWRTSTGGTHQEAIIPITAAARDGSGTINNGASHLLGFTYTSGAKNLYRDGSNEFSNADTGAINATDSGFDIGAQPRSGPTLFWNGSIQEVVIFNAALSASDIATLYNAGTASASPPPGNIGIAAPGNLTVAFGQATRAVTQEYLETATASSSPPRAVSQAYLEVLGVVYPPPGNIGIAAPAGLSLSTQASKGDIGASAPGNLALGSAAVEGDIGIAAPGGLALATQAVEGDVAIGAPGNLTITSDTLGTPRLEEVYVEAESLLTGRGQLDQVYLEAGSVLAATARLDQVYVEAYWTESGWRGWGIPI